MSSLVPVYVNIDISIWLWKFPTDMYLFSASQSWMFQHKKNIFCSVCPMQHHLVKHSRHFITMSQSAFESTGGGKPSLPLLCISWTVHNKVFLSLRMSLVCHLFHTSVTPLLIISTPAQTGCVQVEKQQGTAEWSEPYILCFTVQVLEEFPRLWWNQPFRVLAELTWSTLLTTTFVAFFCVLSVLKEKKKGGSLPAFKTLNACT